jgi:hypothetical protein
MAQALGEDGQGQQNERDVGAPEYGVENHGFTLLGVIPRPSHTAGIELPLVEGDVFSEPIFNALVLKGAFRETKECPSGRISENGPRLFTNRAQPVPPFADTRIELALETIRMDGGCDIKRKDSVQ